MEQDTRELLTSLHNLLRQAEALLYEYLTKRGVEIPAYPATVSGNPSTGETPPPAQDIKLEDVRKVLVNISKTVDDGARKVRDLLAEFNVTKLSDIPPKDFTNVLAKAKEIR